jgi:hypothetical protein
LATLTKLKCDFPCKAVSAGSYGYFLLDTNQQVWQVQSESISIVPELKDIIYMNSACETVFINDLGKVFLFCGLYQIPPPRMAVQLPTVRNTVDEIPLHNMQQVVVLHHQLVGLDLDGNLWSFSKNYYLGAYNWPRKTVTLAVFF